METDGVFGLNSVEAVLIAGVLGALFALLAIISQRSIAARQATIQYIYDSETDRDLIKARIIFNEVARAPEGTGPWALRPLSKEFRAIMAVLNQYEMVAIGIQRGTLDDTTFRRWHRTSVLRFWNRAAPFVLARRQMLDNHALWHEFEEMARWYRGGPMMPRRQFFWRKFF